MEFQNPWEKCSDDDEALSFCDLVTEQGVEEFGLSDSNKGSLDQDGFDFDFEFGRCGSTTDHLFPADDLFRHGRFIPLSLQSVQYSSFEKSKSENLLVWRNNSLDSQSSVWSTSSTDSGEILRRSNSKSKGNHKPAATWRNDLLESQSSYWSTSCRSQRKTHSGEVLGFSNSKSKGNYKPPASQGKMSAKWRSLTLMKTPPLKMEDMRLRQGKSRSNINGAKTLDLRRSGSCNYYKDLKLEEKQARAVNFEQKCRSGKENVVVKKTAWLRGWKTLARCPSLSICKTSSNAVVDNGILLKAARLR